MTNEEIDALVTKVRTDHRALPVTGTITGCACGMKVDGMKWARHASAALVAAVREAGLAPESGVPADELGQP